VFNPIGVVSITTSTPSSRNLGFCTVCLALIHINKMVVEHKHRHIVENCLCSFLLLE
jgi:hypothetical protein